jgi:D-3-phosphoglycerate dehydrogenase
MHVPLVAATKHLINAQSASRLMRPDAVLLNFSREGVVDDNALLDALGAKRAAHYVCDFPGPACIATRR